MKKRIFLITGIMLLFLFMTSVCAGENDTLLSDDLANHLEGDDSTNTPVQESAPKIWYVNASNIEDGDGSSENPFNNLKSSLNQSNDGDTIYIAPGTYSGLKNVNLTVSKKLNLINLGDGDAIFEGENKYQIFNVSASSLNITGLTFSHGYTSNDGGCLYFSKGLENSTINASFIESSASNGGAIFFNGDVLNNVFTSSFISNNALAYGGAIYIDGENKRNIWNIFCKGNIAALHGGGMYINCTSTNNTFNGYFTENEGRLTDGGAIYFDKLSNYDIFSGNFYNNSASYYGGAIKFTGSVNHNVYSGNFIKNVVTRGSSGVFCFDRDVNNSVFSGNFKDNILFDFQTGGVTIASNSYNNIFSGVFVNNSEGSLWFGGKSVNNIFNGTYANHTSKHCGAIHFEDHPINNIFSGIFINNTLTNGYGGAISFFLGDINSTINGTFINNSAKFYGGAIAIRQQHNYIEPAYNTKISATFINNTAQKGGAVYINYAYDIILTGCKFENNTALQGGALFLDNNAYGTCLINLTFRNNNNIKISKSYLGGAVYLNTSDVTFDSCIFDNNWAYRGGAVYAAKNATVEKSNFTNNYAQHDGGAIYFASYGNLVNSILNKNYVSFYGGGAYFVNNGKVVNSKFTNNNASFDGAGAYFSSESNIIDSKFVENYAKIDGGAIIAKGKSDIRNSEFINNYAIYAGAVHFEDEGNVDSCAFTDNIAKNNEGGAIISDNVIRVNSSNFTRNHAVNMGGAIFSYGEGTITNSNFIGNNATSGGAISTKKNLNVSRNVFKDNHAQDGTNDIELQNNATLKYIVELTTSVNNIKYGDIVKIVINVACEDKAVNGGTVSVNINNKKYSSSVSKGKATIEIRNLNVGTYNVDVAYNGSANYTEPTAPVKFSVSKQNAEIIAKSKAYVINYGGKYSITIKNANGKVISGVKVTFTLKGKNIGSANTNSKGVATIKLTAKILKTAKAGKKNLVIKFGNSNYNTVTKKVKITINKEKTKLYAKNKKFKKSTKTKKYIVALKNSKGKTIKKAKLTLKVKGKKYTAKTNSKGKAVFKITKLTKKGKYTAKIIFKSNSYYKATKKTVKIIIK